MPRYLKRVLVKARCWRYGLGLSRGLGGEEGRETEPCGVIEPREADGDKVVGDDGSDLVDTHGETHCTHCVCPGKGAGGEKGRMWMCSRGSR